MSKLIGTNPNQVPSNADLGSAAFMDAKDFLTARGSSLSAIDAVIPKTARGVYIYDTSLDSDGGAWRKRCQHLSWYNEKLNTTVRGSRREFPAVAVLVIESNKITIFDGDDPTFPMWMVFEEGYNAYLGTINAYPATCVAMLNGIMVHGATYDVHVTNFLLDKTNRYGDGGITTMHPLPISRRNDNNDTWYHGDTTPNITARYVSAVAMKVLPGAPVDPSTGINVPSIAVATNGGANVIKHDGEIVKIETNLSTYEYVDAIDFTDDNKVIFFNDNAANARFHRVYDIPSSNIANEPYTTKGTAKEFYSDKDQAGDLDILLTYEAVGKISNRTFGNSDGITQIAPDYERPASGMVNYITKDFNSGWMKGDIRTAALGDVNNQGTLSSVNKHPNPTYAGASGATVPTGWFHSGYSGDAPTFSVASGTLTWTNPVNSGYWLGYNITDYLEHYGTYAFEITINVTSGVGPAYLRISQSYGSNGGYPSSYIAYDSQAGNPYTARGTFTWDRQTPGSVWINLGLQPNGSTATFSEIKIWEAERDLSYKRNRNQYDWGGFYSTDLSLKKTPVAAGAELCSYSGFAGNTNTMLRRATNNDLQFGTDDYYMMAWLKHVDDNAYIVSLHQDGSSSGRTAIEVPSAGVYRFLIQQSGAITIDTSWAETNEWHHVCVVRSGDWGRIYINGELRTYQSGASANISNPNAYLNIGNAQSNTNEAYNGQVTLVKVGSGSLSSEQIAKIYNDEKALFEPGAKATIYGDSNVVNALTHDKVTGDLHVGTSSGRSVFRGIRRVDNTTDPVSTSISAVNGMVVEE